MRCPTRWKIAGIGAVLLVIVASCTGPLGSKPGVGKKESPAVTAESLASHKYWEIRVTPEQIREDVEKIGKLDRDRVAVFNWRHEHRFEEGEGATIRREFLKIGGPGCLVIFNMRDYQSRPTAQQIMDDFKAKLDVAEFAPRSED